MTPSIQSVGAYAPAYRLPADVLADAWGRFEGAGISETAVPDADEDTLTMAYEAASLALEAADRDGSDVAGLYVGTTTPPAEEEAMAPRLASTLGLDEGIESRQSTGSTRAGVDALATALDATIEAPRLAVATDAPRGAPDDAVEHAGGAGAAALVLTPDGSGEVTDRAEYGSTFPGTRFRPVGSDETTGLGITQYDRQAYVETVVAAAERLDGDLGDADAVALQSPDGKLPYRATGPLGVDEGAVEAGTTVHDLGDTGAASPLLGLASALEAGHANVGVVGYGSGGCATAMEFEGSGVVVRTAFEVEARLDYAAYLRMRGDVTPGEPAGGGAYVSVPSWKRTIPQRHRLVAGRCRECGTLAFPPGGACEECGALDQYDGVELPGTGTVEATTVIGRGGAPPEFVEQQARSGPYVSAVVELDGPEGADDTVSTPAQVITVGDERGDGAGVGNGSVAVGDRVAATIRRIYTQEGVTRYGFKMRREG